MIYQTIWVSIYSSKTFKTVWSGLFISTLFSPCTYRLDRNGMLLKFLLILITVMYFKDRNWISKTVNCISCSVVCKIVFCSEFPDIRDNAGKVTRRRRRRTQTIAKRYAFHANVIKKLVLVNKILWCFDLLLHLVLRLNMVNSFLVSLESPVMINILYEMIKILHEKMLNAIYFYWFQKDTSEKNN